MFPSLPTRTARTLSVPLGCIKEGTNELYYQDRDIARRRFEVMQWIAPPTTVLAPTVLLKILWAMAREFFKLFK